MKKEVEGRGVLHSLFPRWQAVAGLLFYMYLQGGFYRNYSSPFPGLG